MPTLKLLGMDEMHYLAYESLLEKIETLKELSEEAPIIVEGKRDEEALRNLGIKAEVLLASSAPFHEFCDAVAKDYPEVILFTDLDAAGSQLAKRLKDSLTKRGVGVNGRLRKRLLGLLDTHCVEDLDVRLRREEEKLFGFKSSF